MTSRLIAAAFQRVDALADFAPADFEITPLPGYTNLNFRLVNDDQDWVLRIPRAATNAHIDRDAEAFNQALAAELGIAPLPRWCDGDGLSLTPTIRHTRKLEPADLVTDDGIERFALTLRGLHRGDFRFRGRIDLNALLERYFALLDERQRAIFANRMSAARQLLPLVDDRDCAYVPSHNDLVLENLLLGNGRLWLIDWEFSAMASPYWDLATLCNAANLDYAQSRALLLAYCADGVAMEESLLFDYRNLLKLLTDIWTAALVE